MRFNILDPCPASKLCDITPMSIRAKSWLARANAADAIADRDIVQIGGAVTFLAGLDYHQEQFMSTVARLSNYFDRFRLFTAQVSSNSNASGIDPRATLVELVELDSLDHEVASYFNRLGQFYYFTKAMRLENLTQIISKLLAFRHKYTFRSIDAPRNETGKALEMQAMTFGFYRTYEGNFLVHKITDGSKRECFHMLNDHTLVMQETMSILQAIHAVPIDA